MKLSDVISQNARLIERTEKLQEKIRSINSERDRLHLELCRAYVRKELEINVTNYEDLRFITSIAYELDSAIETFENTGKVEPSLRMVFDGMEKSNAKEAREKPQQGQGYALRKTKHDP